MSKSTILPLLDEIETIAYSEKLPIIGKQKGEYLAKLVKKYKPKSILEIGTLIGYSTLYLTLNIGEKAKITTIEIRRSHSELAQYHFKQAGVENQIEAIILDALLAIPNLQGPFDFVFIDASKNQYLDYLKLLEPKLALGTVIVADNVKVFKEEVSSYLSYMRQNNHYQSETIDFGVDAMEITIKK